MDQTRRKSKSALAAAPRTSPPPALHHGASQIGAFPRCTPFPLISDARWDETSRAQHGQNSLCRPTLHCG
eukprot:3710258-Alexandrium_andersonii.AAC.1